MAELLDETSQELRFSRQLLQATMENVTQGISVVDAQMRIVAWNRRYLEMFGYPDGMVYVGRPVADLIRWNAEQGEMGPAIRASKCRSGWRTCAPAPPTHSNGAPQRPGVQHSRATDVRRRLRHHLYRHHRIQAA